MSLSFQAKPDLCQGASNSVSLLALWQLISPALPVGAYSYSEGLEWLIEQQIIRDQNTLDHWLRQELQFGSIRVEAAIALRAYQASLDQDWQLLNGWNDYLSASRESLELRQQSWQMGQSLRKLLLDLMPELDSDLSQNFAQVSTPCNYAIAFGLAAAHCHIDVSLAILGYLSSWVSNLISAGVRLVPLGQTTGQKIIWNLHPFLLQITAEILQLSDQQLQTCSWGLGLASMGHESQYTRLFRS
jgi:urease accessory protein